MIVNGPAKWDQIGTNISSQNGKYVAIDFCVKSLLSVNCKTLPIVLFIAWFIDGENLFQ